MESMTYTLNDIQVVVLENEFDAMAVSELRPLFETLRPTREISWPISAMFILSIRRGSEPWYFSIKD